MEIRIDTSDTKLALAMHEPDGELYVVEYASVWQGEEPTGGSRIIRSCGPINRKVDLGIEGPLEPSPELFDRIDNGDWDLTDEDAGWLQSEEDGGNLTYPVGVR